MTATTKSSLILFYAFLSIVSVLSVNYEIAGNLRKGVVGEASYRMLKSKSGKSPKSTKSPKLTKNPKSTNSPKLT